MKKPDITPGEWISIGGEIFSDSGYCVCSVYTGYNQTPKSEQDANAYAIRSVPNMIDALVVAYKMIGELPPGSHKNAMDVYIDIEEALGKAGVKI